MIAIRLKKDNSEKILNRSEISRPELEAMIDEYDTPTGSKLIFVPNIEAPEFTAVWATIPEQYFFENYESDHMSKIDTEFVEITHK